MFGVSDMANNLREAIYIDSEAVESGIIFISHIYNFPGREEHKFIVGEVT